MPHRSYHQYCSLARALDVVGDRWSMLVIRNLLLGPQRWSELRAALPGVAKNLLSSRLKHLESSGVISSEDGHYALTDRGRALQPALFELAQWGEQHFMGTPAEDDAFRLRYLMTSMRRKLRPNPVCGSLQVYVDERPFTIELGPEPLVVQGIAPSNATLRCGLDAFRTLLFTDADLGCMITEGQLELTGDIRLVEALLASWPNTAGPTG